MCSFQQEVFPASDVMTNKRPDTAATKFKNSLNQLMEILMNKEPSYIRCIKPNDEQRSGMYTEFNIFRLNILGTDSSIIHKCMVQVSEKQTFRKPYCTDIM